MAIEDPADLDVFFDPNDFAVAGTLTTSAGSCVINGVFSLPYIAGAEFEGVESASAEPSWLIATKDLPEAAAVNDTITFKATTWAIAAIEPQGDGATTVLRLKGAV